MATIVTCYYKIKSKHSEDEYDEWIRIFLSNLNNNSKLIIFTSRNLKCYFEEIIRNRKNIILIFKELNEFDLYNKYKNIWEKQYEKDPQKEIRTIDCYVIWNSKLWLIKEAIKLNPFNSDKFIWNDIGSFRDITQTKYLINYPVYEKIRVDKVDIVKIDDFEEKDFYFHNVHFAGSIFGGGKNILLELHDLFYKMFDIYLENDKFIGCDQQILASVYVKNKNIFNLIDWKTDKPEGFDRWFYMYYYYS